MSTPFHVFKGTGLAVATCGSVGVRLGSSEFFIWMFILILATNMADKDVFQKIPLRIWFRRRLPKDSIECRIRAWCWYWGKHRKISHSLLGLWGDLRLLMGLTSFLQFCDLLPKFDPTGPLLWALALHLVVDMIDGSEGVALLAPVSKSMFKLPALFQDLDLRHLASTDPLVRREFWYKVKWEATLVAVFNTLAYAGVLRL